MVQRGCSDGPKVDPATGSFRAIGCEANDDFSRLTARGLADDEAQARRSGEVVGTAVDTVTTNPVAPP
jgi:hypothetical protein